MYTKIHTMNTKNFKEEKRASLVRTLEIPKTTRAIILAYIYDEEIRDFLREATLAIGVKLLEAQDASYIEWADAFITDNSEVPLRELIENVVVPIVPKDIAVFKNLSEFNPMKFEGNAFIFEEVNKFQMFEKIVRYLENIRYPWDKRTLLQNVAKA